MITTLLCHLVTSIYPSITEAFTAHRWWFRISHTIFYLFDSGWFIPALAPSPRFHSRVQTPKAEQEFRRFRESIVHSYALTTHENNVPRTTNKSWSNYWNSIDVIARFSGGLEETISKTILSNLHTYLGKRPTPTANLNNLKQLNILGFEHRRQFLLAYLSISL